MNEQSVAVYEAGAMAPVTPMAMLSMAVSRGAGVEVLKELMALQERYDANQARKAFDEAIAAAKAEIPVIAKNKHVGFDSKKQGATRTDYWHEDLAEIARTIDPILSKHGLSYRFRVRAVPSEPVTVTCILSHKQGHSEENPLSAGRDETGNKNSLQSIGSTITYLQRYSLKASVGLSAAKDDDGKAGAAPAEPAEVSSEQIEAIMELVKISKSDLRKVCTFFNIETITELPASKYGICIDKLNERLAHVNKQVTQ